MQMPYQCMTRCGDILIAARGSNIDAFKLQDGSLLSTWTNTIVQDGKICDLATENGVKATPQDSETPSTDNALDTVSPPAKKRKLSQADGNPLQPREKSGKAKPNNRSSAIASGLDAAAVTVLVSTTDGKYVIAVTGEDKCIRVFENAIHEVHQLRQLSQRHMPKRPCTVLVTDDNSTIISADKFGDVYALPLLHAQAPVSTELDTRAQARPSQPFVPAANELTIHSQRNRKALENQKRQGNKASEKSEPSFEYKLLLGHVSMLTDITLVSFEKKNYIITADRDEHIRISRGIPQSHIIDGFCLGHTEFISRLCIPKERPDILISGGGDDEIFVWQWKSFELVTKSNIGMHVKALRLKLDGAELVEVSETAKIAISGLHHVRKYDNEQSNDYLIVTCEGVPALFLFELQINNNLRHVQTYELPGNPLALVTGGSLPIQGSLNNLVVSIDTVHRAGSTNELGNGLCRRRPLVGIQIQENGVVGRDLMFMEAVNGSPNDPLRVDSAGQLRNLFYNLENLRKREGDGQDE